jgi:phosphatidylserine/phosphatidylglycerophosphate/cardiolipin synthase-like enzyme
LRHRRPRRLARYVLISATVLTALPGAVAVATQPPTPAHADSATPHLDAIEDTLRAVSPGLEGTVWQRTEGNSLEGAGAAGSLLQTPGCWGDATCADRSATHRLLAAMTASISTATRTVDISSLAPLPDGAFFEAIALGLENAAAAGRTLRVRILVGAAPLYHANVVPATYRDALVTRLGTAAKSITLNVASMTTSKPALSWNHSKILLVDGRSAIVGGINFWKGDYIDTTHPVSDVSLAVHGPAASSAGRYLDTLWGWTCGYRWNPAYVWFAASDGAGCLSTLDKDANPTPAAATGNVPVIAVGSLGVGIRSVDPTSTFRPTLPSAADATCVGTVHDNTNADRDYQTVNPDQSALRALIASADSHVEISQQDVNGVCPPLSRYDIRLYDTLAAKLVAGVKVRIVVSDPANRGLAGSGGYSQIKSLAEVSDTLRSRVALITGDQATARTAMCGNLQLASFRDAPTANWADGKPYALHHKLVVADGSAFYIGSKNLYPSWLQDFGYLVESKAAAAQLKAAVLDREWQYSQATATVDYDRGICPA